MAEKHWRGVERRFAGRIVAAREGPEQTTFYLAHDFLGEPLFLRLATNSYSMASTAIGIQRYMKLFAYLPAALSPRSPSRTPFSASRCSCASPPIRTPWPPRPSAYSAT